jgi:hypothetical protein
LAKSKPVSASPHSNILRWIVGRVFTAVVGDNERDAGRDAGPHGALNRILGQCLNDTVEGERPAQRARVSEIQLRNRKPLKRCAFGARRLFGEPFPLALSPFATWQGCRRSPAPEPLAYAAPTPRLNKTGTKSPDNAEIYRATYGEAELVAKLIPFMLDAFLESDRGFAKARKDKASVVASPPP